MPGVIPILPLPALPSDGDLGPLPPSQVPEDQTEEIPTNEEQNKANSIATHTRTIGIIHPPPDIRNIVDKTAQFVAKNGREFEKRIIANNANNVKFNFLTSSDPYHAYYQHRLSEFRAQNQNQNQNQSNSQQQQPPSQSADSLPTESAPTAAADGNNAAEAKPDPAAQFRLPVRKNLELPEAAQYTVRLPEGITGQHLPFCYLCMDDEKRAHLLSFLKVIPPVDFCCVYGSALHTTNHDKSTMVDYILGVSDPLQWHSENLKMNADHYASWMVLLGGAKLITEVADEIGVGVHFNPFVTWNNKTLKYGVVRMHDLVQDVLNWERLYLSGRLQKPVNMLVDNLNIKDVNSVNLRAAVSAALLLLPSKFTEEDLYAKICSLSYMGDLRMFFAEDQNKVKKIVQGQFDLFQSMYKPFLEEYEGKDFLRFSSSENHHANISQDCGLPVARSHVSSLPPTIRSRMGIRLGKKKVISESGQALHEVVIGSREEAAKCMQKVLRRTVMVSSARQAISGLLTVGGVKAVRYLTNKMQKAWRSWT